MRANVQDRMPKCSFKFCKNITSNKEDGISYFRFPQHLIRREKWIEIVRRQRGEPSFEPNTASVVCSKHFIESDLYVTGKGVTRLLDSAVLHADPGLTDKSCVEIKKETGHENSTQSRSCEDPLQSGTGTASYHNSSGTTNENCERLEKITEMDTAHLDMTCEEEDNTQLTTFENPFLPNTGYPGWDYSSDTDERCHKIGRKKAKGTAHKRKSSVEIKEEIKDKSNTESTSCTDLSQPSISKPSYPYSNDTSGTDKKDNEIKKMIEIKVEESSPNICGENLDNRLDDLMCRRDNDFDKFGEYVASILKKMPLQQALDLQPQIVNLINSAKNNCRDGSKTLQIKIEKEED